MRSLTVLLLSLLGLLLVVALGILAGVAALSWFAQALAVEAPPERVRVCHAVSSGSNPFTSVEVDVDGLHGHDEHAGDIIPPVLPDFPDGQNWDEEGQAIYENGCSVVVSPTPGPDPTPLPSPGPDPTPLPATPGPDPVPPPSPDVPGPSPSASPPPVAPPGAGGAGVGGREQPAAAPPPDGLVQEGF